jgi:hypothetical protein
MSFDSVKKVTKARQKDSQRGMGKGKEQFTLKQGWPRRVGQEPAIGLIQV